MFTRTDIMTQLQQQLQGAQERIKNLEGDLQTAHRESVIFKKKNWKLKSLKVDFMNKNLIPKQQLKWL